VDPRGRLALSRLSSPSAADSCLRPRMPERRKVLGQMSWAEECAERWDHQRRNVTGKGYDAILGAIREALEKAASMCEDNEGASDPYEACARVIRALGAK